MTAAIDPGSDRALPARPTTRMTLLNHILFVNCVSILGVTFYFNRNRQVDIKFASCLST
jgi:hypothetical protein